MFIRLSFVYMMLDKWQIVCVDVQGVPVGSQLDVEFSSGSSSTNEHLLVARHVARTVLTKKTLGAAKRTHLGEQSGREGRGCPPFKNKGKVQPQPDRNEDDMDLSCGECDDADHTESSSSDGYQEKEEPNSGTPSPTKRRKVDSAGTSGEGSRHIKGRPPPTPLDESELTDEEEDDDGDIGDDEEEEEEGSEEEDVAETDDGQEEEEEGAFGTDAHQNSEQSQSEYDVSSDEDDGSVSGQQQHPPTKAAVMRKIAAARQVAMKKNPVSPRHHHVSPESDEANSELLSTWKDEMELNTSSELERHDDLLKEVCTCKKCLIKLTL